MIYPKFVKKGNTIGICALSEGLGRKIDDFDESINILKKEGYKIKEEGNVRVNDLRGGSATDRANALSSLYKNDDVDMIMCAAGGDFLYEILPYIDEEVIKENPKWFMGASDPTSVCILITTKLDIASLYGMNGGSYEYGLKELQDNLSILKGDLVKQNSFDFYLGKEKYTEDSKEYVNIVYWETNNGAVKFSGRCIGGCLDVLKDMIGTPYHDIEGFIERYKDDGIVWYLDIFSMSSENVYRTLLQMKAAGWFKYTKGIIFGRVIFESNFTGMIYKEAYTLALNEFPIIMEADIGHTSPTMTLINGAIIDVESSNGKGSIEFKLE